MKTFLKAMCRKTGKWFGLEIEKIGSFPAVITNFVDITEEMANHITPQYSVDPHIETGKNLVACKYCRSRKFGNCSCSKRRKMCRSTDKYDFQCVYCDELEIDYSGASETDSGFYNHFTVSNLPKSAFDKHGNPQGDQFDLAKDGSMKGFTIYVLDFSGDSGARMKLREKLARKGFNIIYRGKDKLPRRDSLSNELSKPKTQLWIISSGREGSYFESHYLDIIYQYYLRGGSLYLWGDNKPLFVQANIVLHKLFQSKMDGNEVGEKIIGVKRAGMRSGIIEGHPIATGIVNFYEGQSIASFNCQSGLRPLVYSSLGNVISVYYDGGPGARVIGDGGFTRLSQTNITKAGTERFVLNCAIWLAHIEKYGGRGMDGLPRI